MAAACDAEQKRAYAAMILKVRKKMALEDVKDICELLSDEDSFTAEDEELISSPRSLQKALERKEKLSPTFTSELLRILETINLQQAAELVREYQHQYLEEEQTVTANTSGEHSGEGAMTTATANVNDKHKNEGVTAMATENVKHKNESEAAAVEVTVENRCDEQTLTANTSGEYSSEGAMTTATANVNDKHKNESEAAAVEVTVENRCDIIEDGILWRIAETLHGNMTGFFLNQLYVTQAFIEQCKYNHPHSLVEVYHKVLLRWKGDTQEEATRTHLLQLLIAGNVGGQAQRILDPSRAVSPSDVSLLTSHFTDALRCWYDSIVSRLTIAPWIGKLPLAKFFVEVYIMNREGENFKFPKMEPLNTYGDILKLHGTRTVIVGEAGIGKSILCLKFVHEWAQNSLQVPNISMVLLLRVRHITTASKTFVEAVLTCLPEGYNTDAQFIEQFLKDNPESVLIFIDGFDELPEEVKDTRLHEELEDIIWKRKFREVKVYITSRNSALLELGQKWEDIFENVLEIKGFTRETAEEFITKIFFEDDFEAGSKLIECIDNNGLFDYAGRHPLLLTVFCSSVLANTERKLSVPPTFTGFFEDVFGSYQFHLQKKMKLIKRSTRSSCNSLKRKIHLMMLALGKIAWEELVRGPKLIWKFKEFEERCSCDDFDLGLNLGILKIDSNKEVLEGTDRISVKDMLLAEEDTVMFEHRLYQEYAAGYYLANVEHDEVAGALLTFIELAMQKENVPKMIQQVEYPLRFATGLNSKLTPVIVRLVMDATAHSEIIIEQDALSMISVHCLHEFWHGKETLESTNMSELCRAINSISRLDVTRKIEETAVLNLFKFADRERIPLKLYLACEGRDQDFIGKILRSAHLLHHLNLQYCHISCFSSPPASSVARHLTEVWVVGCNLERTSEVLEGLLTWALTKAPNLKELSFTDCPRLPKYIRNENKELLSLLKNTPVYIYSNRHHDLVLGTGKWEVEYQSSESEDEDSEEKSEEKSRDTTESNNAKESGSKEEGNRDKSGDSAGSSDVLEPVVKKPQMS